MYFQVSGFPPLPIVVKAPANGAPAAGVVGVNRFCPFFFFEVREDSTTRERACAGQSFGWKAAKKSCNALAQKRMFVGDEWHSSTREQKRRTGVPCKL